MFNCNIIMKYVYSEPFFEVCTYIYNCFTHKNNVFMRKNNVKHYYYNIFK